MPDPLGVGHLVAVAARVLVGGADASRGDVDHVDADRLQGLGEGDRVLDGHAGLQAVDRRDPHEQRLVDRPDRAQFPGDLQRQPEAVLAAPAVGVRAVVGQRREEGVQQVAVGAVQLHDLEAGLQGAPGGGGEVRLHLIDAGGVERLRDQPALVDGLGACGHDGPGSVAAGEVGLVQGTVAVVGALHAGLRTRVGELDARYRTLRLHEGRDAGEPLDLLVPPEAHVTVGDARLRRDGGRLDDDEAEAAERELSVVHGMVGRHEPVFGLVLAHGRDGEAVAQVHVAQGHGLEKLGHRARVSVAPDRWSRR